jgi:ABC-type uncharacterized transport system substrate-binding protein
MPLLSIGILVPTKYADWNDCIAAFESQLAANGWTKGIDFEIEHQSAGGDSSKYTSIARDFVRRPNPIDVIVTGGTEPTLACITETANVQQIKVFFATAGEPGAYFTKLGNNVTGISNEQTRHVKDRLKHMKTYVAQLLAPTAFTVFGVIGNANAHNVQNEITEIVSQAPAIQLKPVQSNTALKTAADIPTVIQEVKAKGAQALYVCTDPLITTNALAINQAGLPTMHAFRKNLGGSRSKSMLFWGPKLTDMFSQAADLVYNWRTTGTFPGPTTPTGPSEHQP